MRLVSFERDRSSHPEAGVQLDERVVPIMSILNLAREEMGMTIPASLKGRSSCRLEEVIAHWDRAHRSLAAALGRITRSPTKLEELSQAAAALTFTAPLTQPASVRDFYAFEAHVQNARSRRGEEVPKAWYDQPVFYFSNPHVMVAPEAGVRAPRSSEKLDLELEVAWVIGREAADLNAQEAEGVIVGLTIMNDWSARDLQLEEMSVGLGPAKGKDFATSLGPAIVTLDELQEHRRGDHFDLEMTARVNGDELTRGSLADLHWTIGEMTAHASRDARVGPNDVMGTGTIGGGSLLDLGRESYLQPGDVVELKVEELGMLRNTVVGR